MSIMLDWAEQEFEQDPAQKTHSPWTQRGRHAADTAYLPSPSKSAGRSKPKREALPLSPYPDQQKGLSLPLLIIHAIVGLTIWGVSLWCWLAIAKLLEE